MIREKGRWPRMVSLVLALVLLLPMSPAAVVEEAQASTQTDINALEKKSESLAAQRREVQEKLAQVRAEKGELMEQKQLLEDDIDLIQQTIVSIQEQIDAIQSQIDSLDGQISDLDGQIAGYIEQIARKQGELEETEAEEARLYELFCRRVRLMEEQGPISYWSILFSSDSFADLLDNLLMVREFMDYDNAIMEDLEKIRKTIGEEKASLEEIQAQLEQARSELQDARAEQQAAKDEQEAARAEQEAAQQELQTQETEVENLIAQISDTEAELEAEEAELSRAAGMADSEIAHMEQQMTPQISGVKAEGSFSWPLPGRTTLTSLFGGRTDPITGRPASHTGIDIPAPSGTPIHCAKSGVVTVSCRGSGGSWSYGNYVVVSHSDGTSTLYAHMSSRAVSVGDRISQGTVVGYVGLTGRTTGYHLHFEVRINGVRTDPARYFSGLTYRKSGRTVSLN